MDPDLPNHSPSLPAGLPDALQIYKLFNQFFIRWANQETQYANMPLEDLAPLDLEQGIFFLEPVEGILVIRSTREFERFLVELACGKRAGKNFQKQGLFLEMFVLFWHTFASQTWRLDTRTMKPSLLKKSIPADWPNRKPDSGCTLFIKSFPLTIRFWVGLTPEESKSWKKSP